MLRASTYSLTGNQCELDQNDIDCFGDRLNISIVSMDRSTPDQEAHLITRWWSRETLFIILMTTYRSGNIWDESCFFNEFEGLICVLNERSSSDILAIPMKKIMQNMTQIRKYNIRNLEISESIQFMQSNVEQWFGWLK